MSDDAAVLWLRAQIEGDKAAAKAVLEAAALFPAAPQRSPALGHQVFDGSGIVVTHDRTVVLPSDVARHIALHDPQDVVADCEAKLAILSEHHILFSGDQDEAYEEFSVVRTGGADQDHGCVTCHYYGQGGVKGYGYCRTIRALASAYRHREGYADHWGKP